jgi:hypothetical protein
LIGCDLHAAQQTLAILGRDTGEVREWASRRPVDRQTAGDEFPVAVRVLRSLVDLVLHAARKRRAAGGKDAGQAENGRPKV